MSQVISVELRNEKGQFKQGRQAFHTCLLCDSINSPNNKKGSQGWYHYSWGTICKKCYDKARDHVRNILDRKSLNVNIRKWKRNHPEKILEWNRSYYQKYPSKCYELENRYFQKYSKILGFKVNEYRRSLQVWAKMVRNRDNNLCQICYKPSVHAHHIFPKSLYPKLAMNINNGISLCKEHHKETHRLMRKGVT